MSRGGLNVFSYQPIEVAAGRQTQKASRASPRRDPFHAGECE